MYLKTTIPINTVLSPISIITGIKLSIRLYFKKDFRGKYHTRGQLGQGAWQTFLTNVKIPLPLDLYEIIHHEGDQLLTQNKG